MYKWFFFIIIICLCSPLTVMSTIRRDSCPTSRKCLRISSGLCLRLQSTLAATQSCTSSFSMCGHFTDPLNLIVTFTSSSENLFLTDLHFICPAGCWLWQCGRWKQTRATYLQPGQSTASQLDRGGQPAIFLLPLLYVCKHDSVESPAQVS